jgi:sugar/nucleoside kinase (ribokinase family)
VLPRRQHSAQPVYAAAAAVLFVYWMRCTASAVTCTAAHVDALSPCCCAGAPHQDVGGEERPLPAALLPLLSYLVPNEPELQQLTGMPTGTEEQVGWWGVTLSGSSSRCTIAMVSTFMSS